MQNKKLAVVVPMYNIEEFLAESLESLLKQGIPEDQMQVILIDDGSIDDTFKIAQYFVKKHPKMFEAYRYDNAGLGAARNRGTRLAKAKYITYLDPDDIIPDNSYSFMLSIIEESGSDIITGNVRRFNDEGRVWVPELHERAILGDFEHTNLREHPELIWDASSWNKIFKLTFLRDNNLYFPEGVLYEDFPMVNPAFAKANGIDVTSRVIYMWRVRQGSITNKSTGAKATRDRIKVNRIALEGLNKYSAPSIAKKTLVNKALNMGIIAMLRKEHYSLIPLEERRALFSELKSYLASIPEEYLLDTKFENLVYFKQVLESGNQNEFDELTLSFLRNETKYSGKWVSGKWVLTSNISSFTKIATTEDMKVTTKLQNVLFDDENLYLKGYVFAEFSDMSKKRYIKKESLCILNEHNKVVSENVGTINFSENKKVTSKFGYNKNHFVRDGADFNYDYSSYQIKIPLTYLAIDSKFLTINLSFEVDGQLISTKIMNPIPGIDTRPKVKISNKLLASFEIDYDRTNWQFQIKPSIDIALLNYKNKKFYIVNAYEHVYIEKNKEKFYLQKKNNEILFPISVTKRLSVYDKNIIGDWKFMTANNQFEKPVFFNENPIHLSNDVFSKVVLARNGLANIGISWFYPKIQNAVVENETLKIEFKLFGWEKEAISVKVMADSKLPNILWNTQSAGNGIYRLILPLTLNGFGEKPWLNFQVVMKFIDGYTTRQVLKWDEKEFEIEGKILSINGVSWEFRRVVRNSGGFAVKRTADRSFRKEIGAFDQFIETKYRDWLREPLLDNYIVMSSFWGRNNLFVDNPEAIYQYIKRNYPHMITIIMMRDVIREYPEYENAKLVSYGTEEYWYYLARAKYFINNVNYTEEQRIKRDGQIELQTMHGTPLKTLGFEVLDDWNDRTYNAVKRKNNNWDYLLVPSDWVANYAKKVFSVNPVVINSGYPRNDKLFKVYSNDEKSSIKKRLNIPLNKKIIAYTPTWHSRGDIPISNYLDVESFYDAIPEDTFVVLKNHHYESWTGLSEEFNDKFAYADTSASIEELYIISDALITDYSSVMFDYILLNKPMIFYAFDYDFYTSNRGINFDFKVEAPGPFVEKQADLEKWIINIDKINADFSGKITSFKNKFVQYDSGQASKRAVDIFLKD